MNEIENKKNDQKIFIKFMLIVALALYAGFVFGAMALIIRNVGVETFVSSAGIFTAKYISIIMAVFCLVFAIIALALYLKNKKLSEKWDGEDDEYITNVETGISKALLFNTVLQIMNMIFLAIMVATGYNDNYKDYMTDARYGLGFITYIVVLVFCTVLSSKIVNLEKKINPEKRGNALDTSFLKEWVDSCDEAEKAAIYESGYAAYKSVNRVCPYLWLVCILLDIVFGTGFLPAVMVAIVWLISSVTYILTAMKK